MRIPFQLQQFLKPPFDLNEISGKKDDLSYSLKLSNSQWIRYLRSYLISPLKKRIGFYGNFGHGDLGDDASFIAANELLGGQILPLSKRCYAFNPYILKCLLIGGGGILRWECPYLPKKVLSKKHWGFPILLLAAGINCDDNQKFSEEAKEQISQLCQRCCYISARDLQTKRFLESLRINNVHIFPDLELILRETPFPLNFQKKEFTIGIVLSSHSEFTDQQMNSLIEVFSQLTNHLLADNFQVLFLPFESMDSENSREQDLFQEIRKRVRAPQEIFFFNKSYSPQQMLFLIKNLCDGMICMRLHSAIFATNAGIPFLCLSYNTMHKAFMEMMGLSPWELSLFQQFSLERLLEKFHDLQEHLPQLKKLITQKREELRNQILYESSLIRSYLL